MRVNYFIYRSSKVLTHGAVRKDVLLEQENPEEEVHEANKGTRTGPESQHLAYILLELRREEIRLQQSGASREESEFKRQELWHDHGSVHQLSSPCDAMQAVAFMPQLQTHSLTATFSATVIDFAWGCGCQVIENAEPPALDVSPERERVNVIRLMIRLRVRVSERVNEEEEINWKRVNGVTWEWLYICTYNFKAQLERRPYSMVEIPNECEGSSSNEVGKVVNWKLKDSAQYQYDRNLILIGLMAWLLWGQCSASWIYIHMIYIPPPILPNIKSCILSCLRSSIESLY